MQINGILLIDKPAGWTSHDVVAKVRNILKKETGQKIKVGHTGTLDPMATGLLILVVGSYTKRAEEFSKLDKSYEAELTLGSVSTTGDIEGKISHFSDLTPTDSEIKSAIGFFVGTYEQKPHSFSAKKIGGQRAYKLARAGKDIELEPKKVTVYSIDNVQYEYPKLKFTTRVSSGTYIRSLAEDIGKKLGAGAYLSSLRRTKVGTLDLKGALTIDQIENHDIIKHIVNHKQKLLTEK